jgi:hypothetical protein
MAGWFPSTIGPHRQWMEDVMRYAGLVAYAPELCRQAILAGRCANESHLLLHTVLSQMLQDDIEQLPEHALRHQLEMKYQAQLSLLDRPRPA